MADAKAGGSARAGKSKGGAAEGVKLQKGAFGDGVEKTDRDRQKTTTGTFSAVTDKPQGLDAAAKKATKPTGDLRRAAHADGKVGKAPKSDGSATNKANALARASLRQANAAALKAGGAKQPDAATVKPDAAAVKTDGAKKPDAAAVKTDGAKKPDAAAVKTDGAKKPDAAAVKTDGAKKPDAAAVKTDGVTKPDAAAVKTEGAQKPNGAPTLNSPKPTDVSAKVSSSVDKPAPQSAAPKLAAPSSAGSEGKSTSAPVKAEAGGASLSSSSAGGAGKGAASSSGAQGPKLEGAQAKREVEGGLVSDRPQGARSDAQPAPTAPTGRVPPDGGDKPAATTGTQATTVKAEGTSTTESRGTAAKETAGQGTTAKESDGQGATKSSAPSQPTQPQVASSSSSPLQRSANAPQPLTADAKLAALTKDVPKAEVAEIAQGVVDGLDRQLNTAVVAQRESDIADALSANTEVAHASRRLADADFFADTAVHIRETADDIDGVLLDDDGRASAAANGLPFVKGNDHSGINLPVITADMKLMASVLANQRMDASDITSGLDDISGSDSDGGGEGGGGDEGGGEE